MPSNAALVRSATGSGIDQCSHVGRGSSSSWARSHTVTTSGGRSATSSSGVGAASVEVEAGAPGGGDGAGMDPSGGMGAGARPPAARSAAPQRGGELGAGRVVGAHEQRRLAAEGVRPGRGRRGRLGGGGRSGVGRRRWSGCRVISPTCSSTSRWWASRFDSMPARLRSSTGERSEPVSSSTMASRIGSPSAAWRWARRSTVSTPLRLLAQLHMSQTWLSNFATPPTWRCS